jgi:hypothetical protein
MTKITPITIMAIGLVEANSPHQLFSLIRTACGGRPQANPASKRPVTLTVFDVILV